MSDDMLAKIRKLLAKAEDLACTPEEAEAFTEKASTLIAKYGIERAMLAAEDPTSDAVGDRVIVIDNPYALDKTALLNKIAKNLRCRAIMRRGKRWDYTARRYRMSTEVHVFGFESDLDRVEMLFTSLLVQAAHALAVADVPYWEHAKTFRVGWYCGFTRAVGERLKAAEKHAERTAEQDAGSGKGPSVALVLADRSALVDRTLAARYPNTTRSSRRVRDTTGMADGYATGNRADLGTARMQGRQSQGITSR